MNNPFKPPAPITPGKLFVLSGPGGVGKTTIMHTIIDRHDNIWQSISVTTRSPRSNEVPGVDYYFTTQIDFEAKFKNDELIEYARVHGSWYGTLRQPILDHLKAGVNVLLDVDVHGGLAVKRNFPSATLIFIAPPAISDLEIRLHERALDSDPAITSRLNAAEAEINIGKNNYDHYVINDDLDRAVTEIEEIIFNPKAG